MAVSADSPSGLRAAAGFTLIEIVITLVLVALALLGLAAIQARGTSLQKGAFDRKTAAAAAQGLAERMRANPAAWMNSNYATAWQPGTAITSASACSSSACTPAALASIDLNAFEEDLASHLTDAGAVITQGKNNYSVTIVWLEPQVWQGGASSSALDADPTCSIASLPSGFPTLVGMHCYSTVIFP